MMQANQRASTAGQRAGAFGETLAAFQDATPEAEDAARAAEAALAALDERVDQALPGIHAAGQELARAEEEFTRLDQERAALAAVGVPDGVAALDENLTSTRAGLQRARLAETRAQEGDGEARQALASGPQRAPLELARQRRTEHADRTAQLPSAQEEAARLAGLSRRTGATVADASAALEELRARRDENARRAEAAEQVVHGLTAAHAALTAVSVPGGVDLLDQRAREAAGALQEAHRLLEAAEHDDRQARAALDSAVRAGPLEQAVRDLSDLRDLATELAGARATLMQAREERQSADAALESAESARHDRQRRLDEARQQHSAADLRAHLVASEHCPVCDQVVTILPAPLDAMAIADAQAGLDQAATTAKTSQQKASAAGTAETKAVAKLESLAGQRSAHATSLAAALSGPLSGASLTALADLLRQLPGSAPSAAAAPQDTAVLEEPRVEAALTQVSAALQARHGLEQAARTVADKLNAARGRVQSGQKVVEAVEDETADARRALRTARDSLVALGAPPADDVSLASAWAVLCTWAQAEAAARAAELTGARQASQAAAQQLRTSETRFSEAESHLARLREDATDTAREQQAAQTRLSELTSRIGELDRLLQDAPGEAEVTAQLALRDQLESAAADAEQHLLSARSDRSRAEKALAGLEQAETTARAQLSTVRDPLVALGAPALDNTGLLAAWTALKNWAAQEASSRDKEVLAVQEKIAAARRTAESLTGRLSADLAAHGLDLAPADIATAAAREVAAAVSRAHAATERIKERRGQADDLSAKRDAAKDEQQVAKLLGDLLRSDRFQRWLVSAAVDTLVDQASRNLAGLSAGQFDLAYEGGDFYVIDHADADSRRSVRTLSGGETFQASLALALALSSQISALSAAGAVRLDSIFLDEGFGTLDPDTLEVVAATLETLAQGERMVGVITHVTALAERVPVRFQVSRDARTSTVVREGLSAAEGGA
jgi:exonuclease SbcC